MRFVLSMGHLLLKTAEDEKTGSRDEISRTLSSGDFSNTIDLIVAEAEKLCSRAPGKSGEHKQKARGAEIQALLGSYPRGALQSYSTAEAGTPPSCAECGVQMIVNGETSEVKCPQCGIVTKLEGVVFEEAQIHSQEGQKAKSGRFNPNRHFFHWWTHLYACEPEEELGDARDADNIYGEKLITQLKKLMRRDSKLLRFVTVDDIRAMLRECKKTSLNKNASLIMKKLSGVGPPTPSDHLAQKVEKYFTKAIEVSEHIRPLDRSNRNYYPFYIYKLVDALLPAEDHEQRRILYYIYLQGDDTLIRDDQEWELICEDPGMKDIKYKPTRRSAAAQYRPS